MNTLYNSDGYDRWKHESTDTFNQHDEAENNRTIEFFADGDNRWILRIDGSVNVLNNHEARELTELIEVKYYER